MVGACDDFKILDLKLAPQTRADLVFSTRWLHDSSIYEEIFHHGPIAREPKYAIETTHTARMLAARKFEPAEDIVAWCNAFLTHEEKQAEDGKTFIRGRPIVEPLINDILADLSTTSPRYGVSVTYTHRDEIRRSVLYTEAAVLFDYKAWFDQLRLSPAVRRMFGIHTPMGAMQLCVLPMGFRPSCQTANMVTRAIGEVDSVRGGQVHLATCVDNIRYAGSPLDLERAQTEFLQRSHYVGAVLNPSAGIQHEYAFLGEVYNHKEKTRRCTDKVVKKAIFAQEMVRRGRLTVRQLFAIFGLLLWSAGTLAIPLAQFHSTFRFIASLHQHDLHKSVPVPQSVQTQLSAWATLASTNKPVPVFNTASADLPELTLFTDASVHGWGVVAVRADGCVTSIGERWTVPERINYQVHSSVVAEPLAIRKAVARFVTQDMKHVKILSDHAGFVFAGQKGIGKTLSYNTVLQELQAHCGTHFSFEHIPGTSNPADIYSRTLAPILSVTHIGSARVNPLSLAPRNQG